jgi:DNA repair exonuclease SbcCD ATPase subunit
VNSSRKTDPVHFLKVKAMNKPEQLNELTPTIDVDAAIDHAVKQLSESDASIQQMRDKYMPLRVSGINDSKGLKVVTAARKEVKRLRCAIENRRKELKADATRFGKAVDTEANRLKDMIAPIESHLVEQEAVVAREKERIAKEAEEARQRKIQERVDRLNAARCPVDLQLIQSQTDDEFETYAKDLEQQTRRKEAEEAAERKRLEEERQKLKAERQRLQEEQDKLNAEREAEQRELERLRQLEADQLAKEQAEQREAQRKAEAEKRRKREESLRPVREQLGVFAGNVESMIDALPESLIEYRTVVQSALAGAASQIRGIV